MADREFSATAPSTNANTQNLPSLNVQAAAFLDLSIEIIVWADDSIAEYQGTRAALEAEGVAPTGTKWPRGFDDLYWEDDKYEYWLRRQRPEGAKGPRKQFLDVDWWMIRFTPHNAKHWTELAIERKSKALRDEIYRQSAKGQAESNERWKRYWAAEGDEEFKAFKALIPGLIPPERKRKRKNAIQDNQQQ